MEQNNYLAQWSCGLDEDATIEKAEGKEALLLYKKILYATQSLEIEVPESLEWESFSKKREPKKATVRKLYPRLIWSIAASMALLFGLGFYSQSSLTFSAGGSIEQIALPDGSFARLNPGSTIQYKRSYSWWNRSISMNGDVIFSVKPGKSFTVQTAKGKVAVLGTVFRVLTFENYFEVSCKEGKVAVIHQDKKLYLEKGNGYNSVTGKFIPNKKYFDQKNGLYYKGVPLAYIVGVIEQIYGLSISIKTSKPFYFTGNLPLDNREEAFNTLTEVFPLQIKTHTKDGIEIIEY